MVSTVNSAFDEFNRSIVNISSERTDKARKSRDWLINQLKNLPSKIDDFPRLYNEKHIKFGSFARNTKIQPLDDIDLMITLHAAGATYSKSNNFSNIYFIHTNNAGQTLKDLSFDNIAYLNSRKVINRVIGSLNEIDSYKSADIHRNHEAATLQLSSYEWNFDIVPAFFTINDFYLIPDGEGAWKATDPRIDQGIISLANQKCDGKVLQTIRTLKYWNRRSLMPTILSYLFEIIVLKFVFNKTELSDYIDFNLRDFWKFLINSIYEDIPDPKKIQNNLNNLSTEEKYKVSQKASDTFYKSKEAIHFETNDRDQEKSINKWRDIFGDEFPRYG
jgi:hypothetical protein